MIITENFHRTIKPGMFLIVRNLWETHHPWDIAFHVNTKYSLWGKEMLDERAIWNMRQRIRSIDSEPVEG